MNLIREIHIYRDEEGGLASTVRDTSHNEAQHLILSSDDRFTERLNRLIDIIDAAEMDSHLNKMLEQVEVYYELVRERKKD